jgi:hypothetical protein
LNKHKDSHPRVQIKKRAAEAIKRLTRLFLLGEGAKLNENTVVFIEDRDPDIDYNAYKLNANIQDDQLIASIILNTESCCSDLVTSDLVDAQQSKQSISATGREIR